MARATPCRPQRDLAHLLQKNLGQNWKTALASLPEDAPEVDQLIEDVLTSEEMSTLLIMQSELSTRIPQMASPFADVLSELANDALSPAQRRFLEAMNRIQSDSSK